MAKIDWVERRLQNWGRWSQERVSNGLGYPRSSTIARAAGAPQHAEDRNVIPVNGLDAWETEQAVRALRYTDGALHALVVLVYVQTRSTTDIGAALGIGARRVYQRLEDAHRELAKWFAERRNLYSVAPMPRVPVVPDDLMD